jgi:hypothetical protein
MPALLIPLLIALIEATPALVEALGKEWALLRGAADEGRDLTPAELVALSENALLAGAALRMIVAQRTGPGGDWARP